MSRPLDPTHPFYAPTPSYVYRADVLVATDGDTLKLLIDLGCDTHVTRSVRLLGLNCPERHGETVVAGNAARAFAANWGFDAWQALHPVNPALIRWPFVVATTLDKTEKYGRLLGRLYRASDHRCLNDDLIASGHAVAWDGKGQRP